MVWPYADDGSVKHSIDSLFVSSPEIIKFPSSEMSEKSEIYGIGICMYKLFTGAYPYFFMSKENQALRFHKLLLSIVKDKNEFQHVSSLFPTINEELGYMYDKDLGVQKDAAKAQSYYKS